MEEILDRESTPVWFESRKKHSVRVSFRFDSHGRISKIIIKKPEEK